MERVGRCQLHGSIYETLRLLYPCRNSVGHVFGIVILGSKSELSAIFPLDVENRIIEDRGIC